MISSCCRGEDGKVQTAIDPARFTGIMREGKGVLWLDFDQPDRQEEEVFMTLGFHHLAVEDSLGGIHHPKADDFSDYVFAIVHTVLPNGPSIATAEVDSFLGRNYVVTFHRQQLDCLNRLKNECQDNQHMLSRGADFLLYRIFDCLMESFMGAVDTLDERLDEMERQVIAEPRRELLPAIMGFKRQTNQLRRVVAAQREVMNRFSRGEFAVVDPRAYIYFRDIYDYLTRIDDENMSLRDLAQGTLDIYLSAISNQLNEVMKRLALVATIFFPLTLIAGIYGMNFDFMPELRWQYGYFGVWGFMVLAAVGMALVFKMKKWM